MKEKGHLIDLPEFMEPISIRNFQFILIKFPLREADQKVSKNKMKELIETGNFFLYIFIISLYLYLKI